MATTYERSIVNNDDKKGVQQKKQQEKSVPSSNVNNENLTLKDIDKNRSQDRTSSILPLLMIDSS
jgi:hypothetical protein